MAGNDKRSVSSSNHWGPDREQAWVQLKAEYLQDLPRQLDGIRTTLQTRDYATIKNHAHRIKGTSGTYHLDSICQIAAQLERLAEDRNADAIAAAINKVLRLVELEAKRLNSSQIGSAPGAEGNANG
jgi:HPt (histidine-containing phosphotransfer) domain-containing protein